MKLLHLDSSVLGDSSVSRQLSREVVEAWKASEPRVQVTYRDLTLDVPPQLTSDTVGAIRSGTSPTDHRAAAEFEEMNDLLAEFLASDAIVIGAPMYNFSIPTCLKAWIDALAQAGKTFAYTPQGPRGLAGGKRVVIASSRGNVYSTPQMLPRDFQERYLVAVMNFFGIDQVEIVRAEGVNRGAEMRDAAIEQARSTIRELFPKQVAAAVS